MLAKVTQPLIVCVVLLSLAQPTLIPLEINVNVLSVIGTVFCVTLLDIGITAEIIGLEVGICDVEAIFCVTLLKSGSGISGVGDNIYKCVIHEYFTFLNNNTKIIKDIQNRSIISIYWILLEL